MYVCTSDIIQKADNIVKQCGTRDPHRIARELGIDVLYYPFARQRGAYKVIMRNRFMFIKDNLHPVMEKIVLLHELGHDTLHTDEATKVGGFKEFNIMICGTIEWNTKQISLRLKSLCPMMKYWNISSVDMMFNRLQEQCNQTSISWHLKPMLL